MKTITKVILTILFLISLDSFVFSQDFTRNTLGYLSARVKKQVYPNDTYSFFNETSIDYGTYIPQNQQTDARVFYRSIWEFDKPTNLPAGSYAKKVELIYNGNSPDRDPFNVGLVSGYSSGLTSGQKWNLADGITTTTTLVGANGTLITAELNGFANIINDPALSKVYIGFKPTTNYINVDLVTLTELELKITYEIRINIIADNNFTDNSGIQNSHGLIAIAGYTGNQNAPFTIPKVVGQSVTISAVSPQTDNENYQRVWLPNTSYKSQWLKNGLETGNYNQNITFTAAESDRDAIYQAQFRQVRVTTSGTLSANETWFSNVTLSGPGDVIVPAGVTLNILDGVTVNLNGKSIRSTGGTINLDPSANVTGLRAKTTYSNAVKGLYPTIQMAIERASSGYEVEIQPGTYSENNFALSKPNLTISGAGEDNTYLNGTLTFNTCNNLNVKSLTCRQISVYYCSPCTLNCFVEGYPTQTGIEMYSSNIWNCLGNVSYCSTGLSASATSGIITGTNYSASYCNISASQSSNLEADNIRFCNPRTYDFISNTSSVIHSYSCHFLNGPLYSGNVYIYGNMDCLSKMNSNADAGNDFTPVQIESDDPAEVEFSKVNNSYFSLLKKIKESKESSSSDKAELYNKFQSIAKEFKAYIKKNPQSALSRTALTTAANSYWLFSNTEDDKDANNSRQSFLNEIISDKELVSLQGAVENLMIDYYIKAKDSNGALNAVNAFIEKYKNDKELLCEGLFKKGLILTYLMNQPTNAAACFTEIQNNYPDNLLAGFAKTQLEKFDDDIKENPDGSLASDEKSFGADAYPNPFNPSTTIRFNIPEEGKVIVKVFDILGREVAVLINEYMQTGSHNVVWSGKDGYGSEVSSGVYFYNIRYNDQSMTRKMMLVR